MLLHILKLSCLENILQKNLFEFHPRVRCKHKKLKNYWKKFFRIFTPSCLGSFESSESPESNDIEVAIIEQP